MVLPLAIRPVWMRSLRLRSGQALVVVGQVALQVKFEAGVLGDQVASASKTLALSQTRPQPGAIYLKPVTLTTHQTVKSPLLLSPAPGNPSLTGSYHTSLPSAFVYQCPER